MRAEDEGWLDGPSTVVGSSMAAGLGTVDGPGAIAGLAAGEGPSASAVLAVAEGLRRLDPQLSAALAEHAARLSDDDDRRGEAELSAVLARRELDRPDEVANRGVSALRQAELAGRERDATVLRCALADAALAWSDTRVAEALIGSQPTGSGPAAPMRLVLTVARADLAAAFGDVTSVDALATQVEGLSVGREDGLLARSDLARARARARTSRGDLAGARALLAAAADEPVPDAVDGGRRRLLVVGDLVAVLVALEDRPAAREAASAVLEYPVQSTTAVPLARVRCLAASGVHLPARELGEAAALARRVLDGLLGRGHDRQVAAAEEVLAAVAEARGDLPAALAAQRRAHHLERAASSTEAAARVRLASAVAAAAGPGTVARHPAPGGRSTAAGGRVSTNGVPSLAVNASDTVAPTVGAAEIETRRSSAGRRARSDPAGPAATPSDGAPVGRSRPNGDPAPTPALAPHGLSRILDEITADARATPTGSEERTDASRPRSDGDRAPGTSSRHGRRHDVGHTRDGAATATATGDEYAEELRLTLVDLLAEYGDDLDDALSRPPTGPTRGGGGESARPTAAPPTAWSFHDSTDGQQDSPPAATNGHGSAPADAAANGHGSASAEAAANGHGAASAEAAANGHRSPVTDVAAGPRRGDRVTAPDAVEARDTVEVDSGARLADLLADAMDAFRRTAPGNGTIGPVPPAPYRETDRRSDLRPDHPGARR